MLVKRTAACTHLSSTVYELYSEILVGNLNFFLPLEFTVPVGAVPIGIPGNSLVPIKLES